MAEGRYIDVEGHRTWVIGGGGGGGELVVLHGGLDYAGNLSDILAPHLAPRPVMAFDRPAHGRTPDMGGEFHYRDIARHTIGLLERTGGGARPLVGFSDGGIVSLYVALARPDLVSALVLFGASYNPDGSGPVTMTPEDDTYRMLERAHAERSPDGPDHFGKVASRIFRMWAEEPNITLAQLATIAPPVLVMAGDRDIVAAAHTVAMFEALPRAQLAIVPGTSHGMPFEKPALVGRMILDFLEEMAA